MPRLLRGRGEHLIGPHLSGPGDSLARTITTEERLTFVDKRALSERDICTKFITPALRKAGWDEMMQIREEAGFTKGRIIVRGKLVSRGQAKRADYILYFKPNIPLALIEAKDNSHSVGDGMQQGLDYATMLDIPFVFSSNGDGFVFHDRTRASDAIETNLGLDAFPSPADLWARYRTWKGLTPKTEQVVLQDYFDDGSGKAPRYYQVNAGLRRAVAQGKKLGRPQVSPKIAGAIRAELKEGRRGIRKIAAGLGVGVGTVRRIKAELTDIRA
jgi:type I site-specific restriction endonuclease